MTRGRRWRLVASGAACVALTLLALAPLEGYFADARWWVPAVAAAVAGVLAAVVAGRLRWSQWAVVGLAVAGTLVVAALATAPAAISAGVGVPRALALGPEALLRGWSRMLSVGVPAAPRPPLLVLPLALTWVCGLASAVLALRTRAALAPLLPPVVLLVVCVLVSPTGSPEPLLTTGLFVAAGFLLALSRSLDPALDEAVRVRTTGWGESAGHRRRLGRAAVGVPVLLTVAALGVGGAAVAPRAEERFDPRDLRPQAARTVDLISPLQRLKQDLQAEQPTVLFTAEVATDRPFDGALRLRTVALEAFDGVTWATTGRFVQPAARMDVPHRGGRHGVEVRLLVEPASALRGPLLPTVGHAVTVARSDVEVDVASGTLAVWDAAPAERPYRVTAWLPVADTEIEQQLPDTSGRAAAAVALPPGLPDGVAEVTDRLAAVHAAPWDKLKAVEEFLRLKPYGLGVPPGDSYAAVARTVLEADGQDDVGFAQQHAAAFAVMARHLGVPARVAVGYYVPAERVADGEVTVTTADAHAWPEVHFTDYGWIPFEPTDKSVLPAEGEQPPQAGGALTLPEPLVDPAMEAEPDPQGRSLATLAARSGRVLALALAAAVVLAVLSVVTAKELRRRRRRRRGTTARRVTGAWSEAIDRLVESGLRPPRSSTPAEVSAQARASFGDDVGGPLDELVPLVEEAAFASTPPAQQSVTRAWECERRLRRALARRSRVRAGLHRRVDPRPLLRRRRRGRPRPSGPSRRRRLARTVRRSRVTS